MLYSTVQSLVPALHSALSDAIITHSQSPYIPPLLLTLSDSDVATALSQFSKYVCREA